MTDALLLFALFTCDFFFNRYVFLKKETPQTKLQYTYNNREHERNDLCLALILIYDR